MAAGSGNNSLGGGGGGGGGSFWSRIFSRAATAKDEEYPEWDSHCLPANIIVELSKLSGSLKYKLSKILLFEIITDDNILVSLRPIGTDDSLFEMISVQPGEIYTKAQLQEKIETMDTCGMFQDVDLDVKPEPDGTLCLIIWVMEKQWASADRFRCINVGGSIEKSRPCLLPMSVQREVSQMLTCEKKVSFRMLQKIQDRVQKWYHDEGYSGAQVVAFGNLNMEELVCHVAECTIAEIVIQFVDEHGKVREGNTPLSVVTQQIPEELREGQVFNIEAGKQALSNIFSLKLFSKVEIDPQHDEKNVGALIVEINLEEL